MALVPPHDPELSDRLRAAGCVFAEDEAALLVGTAAGPDELERLVARRVAGEPLEWVLGRVEFAGQQMIIEAGVFIPRQRSVFLVECAVGVAVAAASVAPTVLDLCCGTGALGAAFRARVPGAEVHASDVDAAAVRCAGTNLGDQVYRGDLFDGVPAHLRFDILLANVPYVPTGAIATMPAEARDHEPLVALDGGTDGLDVLRRVAADAPRWLAPKGVLLTECSADQAEAACAVLARAGLGPSVRRDAERGATVVIARNGSGSC
jgi:release factor glutamine methyltransferase